MKKYLKSIRFILEYLGVLIIFHLIRNFPHSCLLWISRVGGRFLILVPQLRRLILANLAVAFPGKKKRDIRKLAVKNASNLVLTVLEFFWFTGRPEMIEKYVDFTEHTWDVTNKYKQEGHGGIWATPHLGNWELAGLKFKRDAGIPFAVVVRNFNNSLLDRLFNSGRMSEGSRIIPAKGAVKGMLKALKEGFFVATLIDQNTRARDGGIFVDFFGLPVSTSRAPAMFARRQNIPVAVGGCIRKGRRYETFVVELPKLAGEYKDDRELIQDIMKITEDLIREYPDQYLWLYERWLYIPEDIEENRKKLYPYYSRTVTPRFYSNLAAKE